MRASKKANTVRFDDEQALTFLDANLRGRGRGPAPGYSLLGGQKGPIALDLDGNAYRFDAGHTLKLEVVGRDAPRLLAPIAPFTVKISAISLRIPTRERTGRLG